MSCSAEYGLELAEKSLRFFALSAHQQIKVFEVSSAQFGVPKYFPSGSDSENFFVGVACIFKTYRAYLFDLVDTELKMEVLDDFNHRVDSLMFSGMHSDWSIEAVCDDDKWQRLRKDASAAVEELVLSQVNDLPVFDIQAMVNLDEFTPSSYEL